MRNAGIHANSLLEVRRMYNAVGIDVSKGKSTVAVLQPGGTVIRKPFDVSHTSQNLNELADYLSSLDGTTKIVMECTGRYHEPMVKALSEAGLFVSIVNPHLIKMVLCQDLVQVKMRNFSPILTCQKLSLSVRSFIHSFEFVWRHIVAMAMNSFRSVQAMIFLENKSITLVR